MPSNVRKLAQMAGVSVIEEDIIYKLQDTVKERLQSLLEPEIIRNDIGSVTLLATFKMDKSKMIVGGKVTEGKMKRGSKVAIAGNGKKIMYGKITQLQHNKKDVTEVSSGSECGMMITLLESTDEKIEKGDILLLSPAFASFGMFTVLLIAPDTNG